MEKKVKPKNTELISSNEKIARLLALLVVKDLTESKDKILALLAVGFTAEDIASLLNMKVPSVVMAAYRANKNVKK